MASPSSRRPTKRRRSSITELSFQGIATSHLRIQARSVTHVSGTRCHLCLRPLRPYFIGISCTFSCAGLVAFTSPVLDKAGKPTREDDGTPIVMAKCPGMHALRHFHASWCINRKADGGLELPAKVV